MTAIIILGMHRSGTSALAGALESMGAFIGKANPIVKEQGTLVSINENILSENNCTWDTPGKIMTVPPDEIKRAKRFISELSSNGDYFVLKDPRLVLTIEQWIEHDLTPDYKIITTFRNPISVAKSLNKRNPVRWSIKDAIHLWCEYNTELIKTIDKYIIPVIDFDQSIKEYISKLNNILASQDIKLHKEQSYLDEGRVTWKFNQKDLESYPEAHEIYNQLKSRTLR